jgi:S-adenosylmethionine synthetase
MRVVSEKGRLFTSESVTEGHPDKICDAISDSVLDALLAQDPRSRVAVETLVTTGQVHVVGEVTTTAKEAFAGITNTVRQRILDIGYDSSDKGFDGASCGVNIGIGAQSPDIAIGKAAPVGLFVETFGTEAVDPIKIEKAIGDVFDLRPGAITRADGTYPIGHEAMRPPMAMAQVLQYIYRL